MIKITTIVPKFLDRIPKNLEDGILYISEKYCTSAHNCCCGCGSKIVTPIKPGRWSLTNNSGRVSLYPSVGNWSSACQSHYWIKENNVIEARGYTAKQIAANRVSDQKELTAAHAARDLHESSYLAYLWITFWAWIKSLFSN